MIDASKLGEEYQEGSTKKVRLTDDEINLIVDTFENKKNIDDFSIAVSYDELIKKNCSLSAGQYFEVKIEYVELTLNEFNQKMANYQANLDKYFSEGKSLEDEIKKRLRELKYE